MGRSMVRLFEGTGWFDPGVVGKWGGGVVLRLNEAGRSSTLLCASFHHLLGDTWGSFTKTNAAICWRF